MADSSISNRYSPLQRLCEYCSRPYNLKGIVNHERACKKAQEQRAEILRVNREYESQSFQGKYWISLPEQ